MSNNSLNSLNALDSLTLNGQKFSFFSLLKLEEEGITKLEKLPFSIRVLLENTLRNEDAKLVTRDDVLKLANYKSKNVENTEIPFMPARVVLQDFTGVPAVVDLAAMRDAVKKLGGNPDQINPIVKSDLVIDHSVQVDQFGTPTAFSYNVEKEFERNAERYTLLKWAQKSFKNFSAVPPGTGIVHQVNLEYLASVVMTGKSGSETIAFPDTLVGTDSHTTMINGISVLGWGVGGIEAEAVMLGQPYYMLLPEVVGVKLSGELPEGATATDLVLTITEMLRKYGVVGKFVEFFGKGLSKLSLPDRATIANMAPEYGATMGFFPIDEGTLNYLKLSGRRKEQVSLVESYAKAQGIFRTDETPDPEYAAVLELDISTIEPTLAGPKRPQDKIFLSEMKPRFQEALKTVYNRNGNPASSDQLTDGSVVIAAITSCTNTSNPTVMIAAGLLAKKALEKGIKTKPWVKTSLAPGSRVVTEYLEKSGTLDALNEQGFNLVGYGCTTCIGNSGPLPEEIEKTVLEKNLIAASVLSGNRNFEGRIHAAVKANYLASPPLVVAYALSGTVNINLDQEPIGQDKNGRDVFLRDIWPGQAEIKAAVEKSLSAEVFEKKYRDVFKGDQNWQSLDIKEQQLYQWDKKSTYIKNPPFFEEMSLTAQSAEDIKGARVLALLGDTVTTDHISPAGAIPQESPAGKYLLENGVPFEAFNSYGSRRGNHEVMMRGTFANIRIKNLLLEGVEGGFTRHFSSEKQMYIYDAAMKYKQENVPLLVLAGKEYGTGSSRDWAAKGTFLLGVKAVIAESFERIHRSNLIGMGVLPLQFSRCDSIKKLGLTGTEIFEISGIKDDLHPGKSLKVIALNNNATRLVFNVTCRLDTHVEVEYYKNGGILQTVLRQMVK